MCADWQPISKSVVEPASDSEQLVLHAKDEIKKLKALLEQYKTKEQQVNLLMIIFTGNLLFY